MPKKKEFLIILVLAVLVTGLSWFYVPDSVCGFKTDCNRGINPTTYHGWPLRFMTHSLYSGTQIETQNLLLDFIFWFLVLAGGWWMFKFVFKRVKKNR